MAKKRKRKKAKKNRTERQEPKSVPNRPVNQDRDFTALFAALVSYFLLWLAMPGPGRGIYWLGWVAMIPLCWLIHSPTPPHKLLRQVWIASLLFWLVLLHFVRLPFWMLWFGWFALAAYLSVYGPLFVSISRMLVHRYRVPTVLAVPIIFTGLEWVRVNFLTGFGLGCLSHSQYQNPATMQVAEFFGAYGISFVMMLAAAAIAVAVGFDWRNLSNSQSVSNRALHAVIALVVIGTVFGFGTRQLANDEKLRKSAEPHKHLKVAIIQSSIDTILKPKTGEETGREFVSRCDLTHSARLVAKELDLIIWPESSFPYGLVLSDVDAENTKEMFRDNQTMAWRAAVGFPGQFSSGVPLLAGSSTHDPQNETAYNSALLFDQSGTISGTYHKNHLVMFGEYFPVVRWIPGLKSVVKGFSSWDAGTEPGYFLVDDVSVSPNICFESTVPHLILNQINTLEATGKEVDVMVNVTNDGWFFGTSCLDMHLACNVLRAVEMRKPMLVSANTGFSAHIDEFGRLVKVGPRRKEAELICDVRVPLSKTTIYRSWGSWAACLMGWFTVLAGLAARFVPDSLSQQPAASR